MPHLTLVRAGASASHGLLGHFQPARPRGRIERTVGLLGLGVLRLLDAGVGVLRAVGIRCRAALVATGTTVVLEVLIVDIECLLDLLAQGAVITGAMER